MMVLAYPLQTPNASNRPTDLHEPRSAVRPIGSYPAGTIQAMSVPQVPDDGVKHLTTGNWLEPDPICLKFVEVDLATGARRPRPAMSLAA